jgi:hypothetical protein
VKQMSCEKGGDRSANSCDVNHPGASKGRVAIALFDDTSWKVKGEVCKSTTLGSQECHIGLCDDIHS